MGKRFKLTKKVIKTFLILFIVIFTVLIISYNYTYVDLTPEVSDENFIKTRIGPISVEMPKNFSLYEPNFFRSHVRYKDFGMSFTERKIENNADQIFYQYCDRASDREIKSINNKLFSFIENNTILYSPDIFPSVSSEYRLEVFLSTGIITFFSAVTGKNVDERHQTFKNRVYNLLKYYTWLEKDINTEKKGFKTVLGFIKPNNVFYINTRFSFLYPKDNNFLEGISLSFNFYNTRAVSPYNYFRFTFFDKLAYYISARFYYSNIFMGYKWTFKQKNIKFASSYSGLETILMDASKKNIPVSMEMLLTASDNLSNDDYFNCIRILFRVNNETQQNLPNHNVIFGYWKKVIESAYII
jgi:hypothetical protein